MRLVSLWLLLISPICLGAQTTAYQQWLDFRQDLEQQAGGPTGMYAIQDMLELDPGEVAWLPTGSPLADLRWSKAAAKSAVVIVRYEDGQAMLSGPGIERRDLLKLKDRQSTLPDGLTVRVSFLGEHSLKVWLYNAKLTALRRFEGLQFFPYDESGVVTGTFHPNEAPVPVNYLDSRDHAGIMYVMGHVQVVIDGKPHDLRAFSYEKSRSEIEWLLLLLKDRTSGKTTYGGGRVVEVQFPKGKPPSSMTVNLNTAYSFLCAHSNYYNCPLALTDSVDAELNYGEKYVSAKTASE